MPRRLTLRTPVGFSLRSVAYSHGWPSLAPFGWQDEADRLTGVLRTVAAKPLGFAARDGARGVNVSLSRDVGPRVAGRVRTRLERVLALDVELDAFWTHCRSEPGLRWIAERGMGRFIRAEDLWEDLAKTLLTTNCTWAGTQAMVEKAVAVLGGEGDRGERAFPHPRAVLEAGPDRLRDALRVGYRARPLWALARRAVDGELDGLEKLDRDTLAETLSGFDGFGPYAVSASLMVLGRSDHQIVDSWALNRARELLWNGSKGSEKRLLRHYARHGAFRGLVAWFDLHPERGA